MYKRQGKMCSTKFTLRQYTALDTLMAYTRGDTSKTLLAFDIETNGLLDTVSLFHCAVTENLVTGDKKHYRPNDYHELLEALSEADAIIAHNGIKYDVPVLKHLFPFCKLSETKMIDTLVISRLAFGNLKSRDVSGIHNYAQLIKHKKEQGQEISKTYNPIDGILPHQLIGSHSLKAWGYRLKEPKGKYGEQEGAWDVFTEDMLSYCEQDVTVTCKLLRHLLREKLTKRSLHLEHEIMWLMSTQERNGFKFNVEAAKELYCFLFGKREDIRQQLINTFGSWYISNGVTVPKRSMNRQGASFTEGAAYTKIKLTTFNPASRQHCARVLIRSGWEPQIFTDSGEPKLDEEVLKTVDLPDAEMLRMFFMLNKRIGQLAEGTQAWLKVVGKDGFIHGVVNPNGANTGRATHSNPNIAQCPTAAASVPYGAECRSLFTVPEGWILLGSDASGLELRCLGHFMAKYDKGAYVNVVLEGDIHWANAQAAGFIGSGIKYEKHKEAHKIARDAAKRFIYAFLYGAGDELIGGLVGYTIEEYTVWRKADKHKNVIKNFERKGVHWTQDMVCNTLKGREVKLRFLDGLPALKQVIKDCKQTVKENACIIGIDGRILPTMSPHAALNYSLQGAGALVCKLWCVTVDQMMKENGYTHGFDGDYAFCAWVHDEIQVACSSEDIAHTLGHSCKDAMKYVEVYYEFKCPLNADVKQGTSWLDTH
uniref:DNA polymerase n=2 Tax=Candidatus Enterovibrio escicola TaxID=1927127 RepID=UPI001CC2C13B|nr:DNA polymerase [Candidatus Enterovibrio escacola]